MADYYEQLLPSREKIAQTNANAKIQSAQDRAEASAKIAALRPPNMQAAAYNGLYQGHLAQVTGNRDLTQQPETPAEMYQAAQGALNEYQNTTEGPNSAKTQGKVAAAAGASHATVGDKIAVKGATPGSSAAAMIDANKTPDAATKAQYDSANKDVANWQKATASQKRTMLGTNKFIVPGSAEDIKEYQRRVAVRDSLAQKLPGGSQTGQPSASPVQPATPQYSPGNPFAK
jgi:hypothetical protein